uniref:Uncharacterized protein n=1 Tax=Rhizophora mucronata TaxID=61149 RepID=A0A2P2PHE8_RHIMU
MFCVKSIFISFQSHFNYLGTQSFLLI